MATIQETTVYVLELTLEEAVVVKAAVAAVVVQGETTTDHDDLTRYTQGEIDAAHDVLVALEEVV